VDGARAVVDHGAVELVGDLGTKHAFHVTLGDRDVRVDVAILEDGPDPASIDVPAPAPSASASAALMPARPSAQTPSRPRPNPRPSDGRSTHFE
jgi:hypothetical protein